MLNKIKKIHFIGIGGIGVSALARMMLLLNKKVVGSDTNRGKAFETIKKLGGKIFIGHKAGQLENDTDMAIYSPAIGDDNPELVLAREKRIPTYSYPEMLGLISKNKYTIAISGTHGKTTTTAMIAEILISTKKDPTIVVGGILKKQQNNFILGKSKYFVVEACEYKKSFLNLSPHILIVTNIDNDHLDYYQNLDDIKRAFAELIIKVPKDGFIVLNLDDKNILSALNLAKRKNKKLAKVINYAEEKIDFQLKSRGEHNILNAKAAMTAAKLLKINPNKIKKALINYAGVSRRFEFKGKTKNNALIYDDYAHHPTEIKATLKMCREYFPKNKIIVIFQPHLYSRTKLLLDDFAKSFNFINELIVTDIYAAREKFDKEIHAKNLIEAINKNGVENTVNARYIKKFEEIKKFLSQEAREGDIILTIGAGNIYQIGEEIKEKNKK